VFANDEQAVTVALWIVFAWTHEAHTHSPILLATSAEANCGKSTLISLVRFLSPRALFTAEISAAALYRSIEKWKPTIVLDEGDSIFRENDELRAVVNTGWTRGSGIIRCDPDTNEPMLFQTFCPKAIGMKGKKLPDTTLSRCIIIELKRKLAAEEAQRFDHLDNEDLRNLRRMLARWAEDNLANLKQARPELPMGFNNRLADNWRPLLSIADLAGQKWPEDARTAAVKLSPVDQASIGTTLLADIKEIFEAAGRDCDRLSGQEIVEALHARDDRPWGEWGRARTPITKIQLTAQLKEFGLSPDNIRVGDKVPKGYYKASFKEAWERYLTPPPSPSLPSSSLHRYNADELSTSATSQVATPEEPVATWECRKPLRHSDCSDVAIENTPSPGGRVCDHCGRPDLPGFRLIDASIGGATSFGHEHCILASAVPEADPFEIPPWLQRTRADNKHA